jgi:hypothetical protein
MDSPLSDAVLLMPTSDWFKSIVSAAIAESSGSWLDIVWLSGGATVPAL